jgi:LmbE family N-acetylglucosaminyl deacetylase
MMETRNILVVAAHPDDEVLGVGGTISLMKKQGKRVTALIVTDGSTAQYEGDGEAVERKRKQMYAANSVLGTDEVIQWDFPDMRLDSVSHVDLTRSLDQLMRAQHYDTVFVHNETDINLDHRLIYHAVLVTTRPAPGQSVRQILTYQVNSSTEWGARSSEAIFCPNVYIDISETIEKKLDAIKEYKDEVRPYPHPRSLEALESRARVYGTEAGFHYAEAFKLILFRGALP